jgi:TPR repeat protein
VGSAGSLFPCDKRHTDNRHFQEPSVRLILFLAILILGWTGAGSTLADMEAGIAAYKRGDYVAAWAAWRPLASEGNAEAQYYLGHLYAEGEGVTRDMGQAVRWFRAAAEQGEPYGQFALGYVYEHGQGVEPDAGKAARWYWSAAEQGNLAAQNNLALMYDQGRGVARNYVQAYYWYARGAHGSGLDPTKAAGNLERLVGKMTPAEIAAAVRLLDERKP